MNSALKLFSAGSAVLLLARFASAQEDPAAGKPATVGGAEFHALQQAVEAQTKQIEALRLAVTQLTERLPAKNPAPPPAPPAPTEASATPSNPPAGSPPPHAEAAPAEPATASADGPQHTVAKGETLTSIAKHYKIPIADIQKANKITDDRKLQIGQVLTIPTPKPSEPAPKKETP